MLTQPSRSDNMQPDKLEAIRKWGTFCMAATSALGVPLCFLVLTNQRLQIEKVIADSYINKSQYIEDRGRLERADQEQWRKVTELGVKIDEVLIKQVRMEDSLSMVKESLKSK